MSDPKAPKLELKMFVLPALLFFTRKLDLKDEKMAQMCQGGIIAVATLILTIYFYVYSRVNGTTSSAATKKFLFRRNLNRPSHLDWDRQLSPQNPRSTKRLPLRSTR